MKSIDLSLLYSFITFQMSSDKSELRWIINRLSWLGEKTKKLPQILPVNIIINAFPTPQQLHQVMKKLANIQKEYQKLNLL